MSELPKCKRDTKCMMCGNPIKKGDECNASSRGTVCKSCYDRVNSEISGMMDRMLPEDECECPYCNGTGRVNRLKSGGVL